MDARHARWTVFASAAAAVGLAIALAGPDRGAAQGTGAYVPVDTWRGVAATLPAGSWRRASGLAVGADGTAFVADQAESRIAAIGATDAVSVLSPSLGALAAPGHLAVDDASGRLYVADPALDAVVVLSTSGAPVAVWPGVAEASAVAVAPDGTVVAAAAASGQVIRFGPDGTRRAAWQAVPAAEGGGLVRAVDVDADGRVYVLEGRAPRLRIFDAQGTSLETLVIAPPGAPVAAFDVAVDRALLPGGSRLYWFGTTRGLVVYDTRTRVWQVNPLADDVSAVALDEPRGRIYVATIGASPTGGRVMRLALTAARTGGAPERTWSGSILVAGTLSQPEAVAVGADGRAYVLDRDPRVQRFELDGTPRGQIERVNPVAVDADADGRLYVTDGGQLQGRAPGDWSAGAPSVEWTVDVAPDDEDENAVALAVEPGGTVAVLDALAGAIRRFDARGARGAVVSLPRGPGAAWADLAAAPDGTLLALDRGLRRVVVMPPSGVPAEVALTEAARSVAAGTGGEIITLDRDGWVRRRDRQGGETAAFDATRFDVSAESSPSDVEVDAAGRVLVSDRAAGIVTVFAWRPDATPVEPPPPGAQCRYFPGKDAAPSPVDVGGDVEVRLRVRGGCGSAVSPSPRDVILVLDRSDSMSGEPLRILKSAALGFVAEMDLTTSRVGVVSFNEEARLEVPLTNDLARVTAAVSGIVADGQTRIDRGLELALDEARRRGRPDVRTVIVLFSDGSSDFDPAVEQAERARARRIEVYAVGIRAWARLMREIATDESHYFAADTARALYSIFERLAERVTAGTLLERITVVDRLPADMAYVPDSALPPAVWDEAGRTLRWDLVDVPPTGFALRYLVRPQLPGDRPTNVEAWGDYVDGFGRAGRLAFPVPRVTVRGAAPTATASPPPGRTPTESPPSPTPTTAASPTTSAPPTTSATPPPSATPTATAGPTGVPVPIHLPLLLRERCVPGRKHADVVLVLDTSSSMAGAKVAAAAGAARRFLDLLSLPDDRVALVTFDSEARLAAPLTGDRAVLEAALAALPTAVGTRIDLGLERALEELAGPRHDEANTPVAVLLTDGRQDDANAVRSAARRARDRGVELFAIGLGADVDAALLGEIAGAGRTYLAPTEHDLAGIYALIAVRVPCAARDFWGRR